MAERSGAERPDSECAWGGARFHRDDDSAYLQDARLLAHKLVFDRQFMLPVTNYELFTSQQPLQTHQTHQLQPQHQHQLHPQHPPQHHVPHHHQIHHQMQHQLQHQHQHQHQSPHLLSYPPRHDSSYGFPSQHLLPNYEDSNINFMNPLDSINPQLRSFDHPSIPDNNSSESYLTNWPGDSSGVYTPFGHNFLSVQTNSSYSQTTDSQIPSEPATKKEVEPSLTETTVKKRIVAEVKPMRPSYSAVLSKTPKNSPNPEPNGKKSNGKELNKNPARLNNAKSDKSRFNSGEKSTLSDEKLKKFDSKRRVIQSQPSSGSDSGENNTEFKSSKSSRRNYSAGENINRKWVSLDDLSNDTNSLNSDLHQNGYTDSYDSEFVFVSGDDDKFSKKKTKKSAPPKTSEKNERKADVEEQEESNGPDDFVYQEPPMEVDKSKKKNKDGRSNNSRSTPKNNSDRNKRNNQTKSKRSKGSGYIALLQTYVDNWIAILLSVIFWFYNLVSDICQMSIHLSVDLVSSFCTETFVWTQNAYGLFKEKAMNTQWICNFGNYVDNKLGHTYFGFWRKLKWFKSNVKSDSESDNSRKNYTNIPLPSTGEDAMRRLLACKGKDPYSILGVGVQCTDDDIKRYYRRQAFLVHPDKNQQPGAEEAFKILQHAFDMIGEPERREAYEQRVLESRHAEVARSELADLVARLQEKVRRAASTIRCSGCSRRHARTPTNRPCYAARYCAQCKINHSAKEGDIWAESSFWGLIWMYYACMDGAVYQITQWASCQKKNLKHLKANTHHVQYRIVHGNKPQQGSGGKSANNNIHDADLEDFLNNLYSKSGVPPPGAGSSNKTMPNSNPTSDPMKTRRKNKKQNFK